MRSHRLSRRPVYLQLRDALAERIAKGQSKPGIAIPNESDLAREFGVSSGTMRKALDLLESERLVTRRQGRGTFVNDQTSKELALRFNNVRGAGGQRIVGKISSAEMTEGAASQTECRHLQLQPRDHVYRIRHVLLHDDQPYMVKEASIPAALFPGLTEAQSASYRIVALAQQFGILLGKATEDVSIEMASEAVAKTLGIATASPILVLDRVIYALDERPVEWRIGRCHPADRYYLAETT